jgi:hypothetical protein
MRRSDREITDRAELLRILAEARVCRVAMSDHDRPYLVPLAFALDGEDIVLHSARAGRKLDILRRNPAVCFEVEEGVEIDVGPSPCATGMRFHGGAPHPCQRADGEAPSIVDAPDLGLGAVVEPHRANHVDRDGRGRGPVSAGSSGATTATAAPPLPEPLPPTAGALRRQPLEPAAPGP